MPRPLRLQLLGLAGGRVAAAYLVAASDRSPLVPLVFSASVLATTAYTSAYAALRATGQVGPEVVNEVVSRLAVLALGTAWLARGRGGLLAAVTVYAAADVVSALALGAQARRRLARSEPAPDVRAPLALRAVAPLAIYAVLGTIYYKVDVWLLGLLRGSSTVAPYAAAYRLVDGLLLPAGALAALVVPRLARAGADDRRREVHRLAAVAVGLVTPAALGAAVLARPLMGLVFGGRYRAGAGALAVLTASVAPGAAVLVLSQGAAVVARSRLALVTAVSLAANVALNCMLIPLAGALGAAWATLVSQCLLAALLLHALGWRRAATAPSGDRGRRHPVRPAAGRGHVA